MTRFTFADAANPKKPEIEELEFDGYGFEIRKLKIDGQLTYQTFCVCGNHQFQPSTRSSAYRWRKRHGKVCRYSN